MAKSHVKTQAVVNKINEDIADCILSLKTQFEEDPIPITDDCLTLQKFCAKLEFLLQHNQKDRFTVLGTKKGYWEYFCQCLASSRKHTHDGIRFVKLKSELKSSCGKGRAFIRFCLTHGCLADSLQRCFSQKEITKEWYQNYATPCDPESSQALISALYDLNDIHFDLSPDCHDLDISWPTFSRKHNDSRQLWKPPSRSVSISSLVSQVDGSLLNSSLYGSEAGNLSREEDLHKEVINDSCTGSIHQRNLELESHESDVLKEIKELRRSAETNHQISLNGVDKVAEEFATKVELLTLQHAGRERYFAEAERVATEKISSLESQRDRLQQNLSETETLVTSLKQTVQQKEVDLDSVTNNLEILKNENSKLLDEARERQFSYNKSQEQLEDLNKQLTDLGTQLRETEAKLNQSELNGVDLRTQVEEFQSSNADLISKLTESCDINNKLNMDLLGLQIDFKSVKENVEVREIELTKLRGSSRDLELEIEEKDNEILSKSNELENLKTSVRGFEEKLNVLSSEKNDSESAALVSKVTDLETINSNLRVDIKCLAQSLQAKLEDSGNRNRELDSLVKSLEHSNSVLKTEISEKNVMIDEANAKLQMFDQYGSLLTPLINQQDVTVDEFRVAFDVILNSSEKLKTDMTKITSILERLAKAAKSELEFPSLTFATVPSSSESYSSVPENLEEYDNFPIAKTAASSSNKLQSVLNSKIGIERLLSICHSLSTDMMAFAVEKEQKLISKRLNLLQTINIVETLVKEHKKVQAAESILKYELQEKRKLLSRLRQQLESTREEWNKVRMKNIESETEWKSLRDDFALRHKQSSEESGFVEEKSVEETNATETVEVPLCSITLESVPENDVAKEIVEEKYNDPLDLPSTSALPEENLVEVPEIEPQQAAAPPRRRIEILEEQCNLLYYSLLHSSKRSELLEQRLQVILGNPSSEDNSVSSDSGAGKSELPASRQSPDGATEESEISNDPALEEDNDSGNSFADQLDGNLDEIPDWENPNEATGNGVPEINGQPLDGLDLDENIDSDEELLEDRSFANEEEYNAKRKTALQNIVVRFKTEKNARRSQETELTTRIKVLELANAALEEKMVKLQRENAQVSLKGTDYRKRSEFVFRKERESFESKLRKAAVESSELKNRIEELNEQLQMQDKELSDCQNALELSQKKKDEVEKTLSQEISSLRFQLSTEALKYERSLKNYTGQESDLMEMREKLNHQEQLIMTLEETLGKIKEERQKEIEKRGTDFEELEIALSTRDEECVSLNEDVKRLTIEMDVTKKFLVELEDQSYTVERKYKEKTQSLLQDLTSITTDNEDLKCQVIKLTRDKDLLWKKSEHLSRSQFSPTGDRWMSDNEVLECIGCKAAFSFILRKHHCRLCGRIFCHNCAGHWVLTPSSSRRARVCTECFTQNTEKDLVWKEPEREGHEEEATDALACSDTMSVDSMAISVPEDVEAEKENSNENSTKEESTEISEHPSVSEIISNLDFDVISDEEIARSLSACSPYSSPSPNAFAGEGVILSSATRSTSEIEDAGPDGLAGQVWINAGDTYSVPVVIEAPGVSLLWEFTSEPKSIAFSVEYKLHKEDKEGHCVLLNTTKVQSHLRPVTGHLFAKHAGVYVLVFDNHFSRFKAKKVSYALKVTDTSGTT